MNCILCGSSSNKVIYNYTRFKKNNILKCNNCSIVFLELKQSKGNIEEFYKEEYRNSSDSLVLTPDELFNNHITRQDCRKRLFWVESVYGSLKEKRVVEIGSASGAFLSTLTKAGAIASGIEFDKKQVEYSRMLGLNVTATKFEENDFKNLDLVVMFHTLEHILDPLSLTKSIHASLKPKGVFLGEVPNQDDWRMSIFDCDAVKRFHYDPYHYYYYSPLSLYTLLYKGGFKSNNISLSSVERYSSLIQLRRILGGYYDGPIDKILTSDIFAKEEDDVRITSSGKKALFNDMFEAGVNSDLRGNCLRWVSIS